MREVAHFNATVYDSLVAQFSEYKESDIREAGFRFLNNLSKKVLLKELSTSSIYEVYIKNQKYIYKIIKKNPNMDFNLVKKSYENCNKFKNKDGLVEVYDFRISEGGENFEVLMEYLEDYYDVEAIEEENKTKYAEKIVAIIENVLSHELIPVDCGLANFVTNGETVKMLDLDFMLGWDQVTYFNTSWFLSRLDEIMKWCPSISKQMDTLKFKFDFKKKFFFGSIPYNPLTQKYIEEGEQLLVDGKNENAIEKFYKALQLTPNSASSYNNLAVAFWNLNDPARAQQLLKVAVELEPINRIFIDNFIDVLHFQNKHTDAQKVIEQLVNDNRKIDNSKTLEMRPVSLQKEIDQYSYPSNYAYDIHTLKPKGSLEARVDYFVKYCPEIFDPCKNFLSVGSSLGYMLLFHSYKADKCTGIEPDKKANDIVRKVAAYRNINNIDLYLGTFKEFDKKEVYDLIWMGNVFQYMYIDYGWEVVKELAKISVGKCIIEAPFEGEYLKQQANLNANWNNERLMNDYKFDRFKSEMANYFDIVSVNPSGTDPVNRLLVVLSKINNNKS